MPTKINFLKINEQNNEEYLLLINDSNDNIEMINLLIDYINKNDIILKIYKRDNDAYYLVYNNVKYPFHIVM